jgi:glycosyltransferase involved in cell wall biosynthesis
VGGNIYDAYVQSRTEESLLSAARADVALVAQARNLAGCPHILTLTPFYPSVADTVLGCFVAEPLSWTERLGVSNHVIAVQPFYRGRAEPANSGIASVWKTYFSVPGNWGLPTAGAFLAVALMGALSKMHRREPFDLIHAHGALPCGHAARLISKKLGIPFVVSVHGLDVFSVTQAGHGAPGWCRQVSEKVYRSARTVICISERVRERLEGDLTGNTRVIYNGVDVEMFRPEPELRSGPTVLSVGNLIPIKGHALLLRGFARVLELVPKCWLEIFGDGPERHNLVRLAHELGISGRVRFQGRQSRETIAAAMRRSAVFALPSSYEGLGCVYLEAMASGKAAIGCRGQGIEEIIEHGKNGFLISPGNEAQLSDCLKILLENGELRSRIGASAREVVLRRHTLEHQARQLTEVYRECSR